MPQRLQGIVPNPEEYLLAGEGHEPPHATSLSGMIGESLESGLSPQPEGDEDEQDPMESLYVGEEMPGGDLALPGEDEPDDMGRASGQMDLDTGALKSTEELLTRRDERRWELDPRSKD